MDLLRFGKFRRWGDWSRATRCDTAVVEWDARSVVTAWRGQASEIFGRRASESIGRTLDELGLSQALANPPDSKSARFVEVARKDGKVVSCRVRQFAARKGIRSYFVDVTAERAADQAACERKRWDSLGVVAGGTAHSLNNLLTGVIGHASLLMERMPATNGGRSELEAIVDCGERAAEIARRMLDFSGQGRFFPRYVDMNQALATALARARFLIGPGVEITTRYSPRVLQIHGDERQLEELIQALIANAAEAIGLRGGKIELGLTAENLDAPVPVSTGALEPGRYLRLWVRDNGCGMDAATRSRMFDPFFTTKFVGRGLGLAAAAGIARGHAGGIRVESQGGRGTTIDVFLKNPHEGAERPRFRAGNAG